MQRKLIRKDKWKYSKSFITSFIPLCCIFALLALCILAINPNGGITSNGSAYATDSDSSSNSGISIQSIDSPDSSASLTIGNGTSTQFTNTGTSDQDIEINVDVNIRTNLIDSYTLQISGNPTLDGSTTVNAVTAETETLPDGSWGYKWNNADKYRGVASTATILENTKIAAADGIVDNTKTLTFAAKFSDQAEAGHYRTDVKLSLIANPKKVAEIGEWTLPDGTIKASGITTMQEMTPEICEQVSTPIASEVIASGKAPTMTLTDSRDNNTYSIARYPDGKCWMTQNLVIMGSRILTSADSNVSSDFTLPASSISGFSSNTAVNAYYTTESSAGATGYYTWCAATAGTCSSATSDGSNAPSSICPKGWRLPGGRNDTTYGNEFYNLFNSMGLGITLGTIDGTNWTSTQLDIAQNSNYNFKYTGRVYSSSFQLGTSNGYWWSSTASSSTYAYRADVYSSYVYPGTGTSNRRNGFAVRCVAQ